MADEAWAELGKSLREDVALIREKADFDIDRILEIEQETCHDVVAFHVRFLKRLVKGVKVGSPWFDFYRRSRYGLRLPLQAGQRHHPS